MSAWHTYHTRHKPGYMYIIYKCVCVCVCVCVYSLRHAVQDLWGSTTGIDLDSVFRLAWPVNWGASSQQVAVVEDTMCHKETRVTWYEWTSLNERHIIGKYDCDAIENIIVTEMGRDVKYLTKQKPPHIHSYTTHTINDARKIYDWPLFQRSIDRRMWFYILVLEESDGLRPKQSENSYRRNISIEYSSVCCA